LVVKIIYFTWQIEKDNLLPFFSIHDIESELILILINNIYVLSLNLNIALVEGLYG
jgi:hypothetical protein